MIWFAGLDIPFLRAIPQGKGISRSNICRIVGLEPPPPHFLEFKILIEDKSTLTEAQHPCRDGLPQCILHRQTRDWRPSTRACRAIRPNRRKQ